MLRHLFIASAIFIMACGQKSSQPIAAPEKEENDATVDDDFFTQGGNDPFGSNDSFNVASTCSYEDRKKDDQCDELRISIKVADATNQDRVSSSVDGRADEPIALAFTVEADRSKYEDAVRDPDRLLFGFRDLPRDVETEIDGTKAALIHVPEREGTERYTAVVRDLGRCMVEHAYDKDGDLDEDKAEECEDLDKEMSEYDEEKTITARIEKSRLDEQKDAALRQIDAQCKANMLTSVIGAVPALFGGNVGGAVLSAGTNTLTGQIQCEAQKEAINSQFGLTDNEPNPPLAQ